MGRMELSEHLHLLVHVVFYIWIHYLCGLSSFLYLSGEREGILDGWMDGWISA